MSDLDKTVGCVLLAALVSCLVQGLQLASATSYVINFWETDRIHFKLLVSWVTVISIANTVAACHAGYLWCVSYYGAPQSFANIPTGLGVSLASLALISTPVQHFFAFRVWVLQGRRMSWAFAIPVLISLLSVASFALLVGGAVWVWVYPSFLELEGYKNKIYAWCGCACAADAAITFSLSWYLYRAKGDFGRSNKIINRLILMSCETNGLALGLAIATALLTCLKTSELWFYVIDSALGLVYALALTVSLNARTHIAKIVNPSQGADYNSWDQISGTVQRGYKANKANKPRPGQGVAITVERYRAQDRAGPLSRGGIPVSLEINPEESFELKA